MLRQIHAEADSFCQEHFESAGLLQIDSKMGGGGGVVPKKPFSFQIPSLTDEEEKTAVEEHFQLLHKEHMLGLAMDWTKPQSSTMVNLAFLNLHIFCKPSNI